MDDGDIVVRGANIVAALVAAIVLLLLFMGCAAFGCRAPDWQFPCPSQEQQDGE